MRRKVLSIWDRDEEYAAAMASYFEGIVGFPYEVHLFTKEDAICRFLKERDIDVLLCGENVELDEKCRERVKEVYILTEDKYSNADVEVLWENSIYKYQSMEVVLRKILKKEDCRRIRAESGDWITGVSSVRMISVYSPWGGSGKTTFSLLLGQGLSKKDKVLYLNFEVMGSSLKGETYNAEGDGTNRQSGGMSDFIYYIKQRREDLISVIPEIKTEFMGMDCLEPVEHFNDIYALNAEDMNYLVQQLKNQQEYGAIICDVGYMRDTALQLMDMSDRIFMPYIQEKSIVEKEFSFRRILKLEAMEHFFDKLTCVTLPRVQKEEAKDFQSMCKGELGEFVWNLAEEL